MADSIGDAGMRITAGNKRGKAVPCPFFRFDCPIGYPRVVFRAGDFGFGLAGALTLAAGVLAAGFFATGFLAGTVFLGGAGFAAGILAFPDISDIVPIESERAGIPPATAVLGLLPICEADIMPPPRTFSARGNKATKRRGSAANMIQTRR
jgi:hypothetical protein